LTLLSVSLRSLTALVCRWKPRRSVVLKARASRTTPPTSSPLTTCAFWLLLSRLAVADLLIPAAANPSRRKPKSKKRSTSSAEPSSPSLSLRKKQPLFQRCLLRRKRCTGGTRASRMRSRCRRRWRISSCRERTSVRGRRAVAVCLYACKINYYPQPSLGLRAQTAQELSSSSSCLVLQISRSAAGLPSSLDKGLHHRASHFLSASYCYI